MRLKTKTARIDVAEFRENPNSPGNRSSSRFFRQNTPRFRSPIIIVGWRSLRISTPVLTGRPSKMLRLICLLTLLLASSRLMAEQGKVLLQDDFEREESDDSKEEVGNGWSTNSKSRAKGDKQVDLKDGAMHITISPRADHGVSVVHDVAFRNVLIEMRFKIGEGDDLGINIADMKEKSVWAGHICVARIRPDNLEISDLKPGTMKLEHREARKSKTETREMKELIKTRRRYFKVKTKTDVWHDLAIRIEGETMTVSINGKQAGQFSSPGIGHDTKSRIRLSVHKQAWVDDVKVTAL